MRLGFGLSVEDRQESSGDGSLSDVVSSAVFDLDATQAASYPGSGTDWLNLVTSPADGSAQSAYNFPFVSTPVFNGTAGSQAAYWTFTTGNYFQLGSNTSFLANLHKTTGGSGPFWIAIGITSIDSTWASATIFNTSNGFASAGTGINVIGTTSEQIGLWQKNSGTGVMYSTPAATFGTGDYFVIISVNPSTNVSTYWALSTTGVEGALTFTTSTASADGNAAIGADTDGSSPLVNTQYQLRSLAMGNEYLDDAKAAAIFAHMEARHGKDYTP